MSCTYVLLINRMCKAREWAEGENVVMVTIIIGQTFVVFKIKGIILSMRTYIPNLVETTLLVYFVVDAL